MISLADLNSQIAQFVSTPETALLAGVLAAFTPCTLALIPIFLYRFGVWGDANNRRHLLIQLIQLLSGYFTSFIAFGLVFNQLFDSSVANISKLSVGTLLILLGVIQFRGSIPLDKLNRVSHPLILGLLVPLIISLSPCVLPVISPLIAGSITGDSIVRFLLFGAGLLVPPILIAIGGNRILKIANRSRTIMIKIEKGAAVLIMLSGIFLGSQLISVTREDILISALIVGIVCVLIAFRKLSNRSERNIATYIILCIVLTVLLVTTFTSLGYATTESLVGEEYLHACSADSFADHFSTESFIIAVLFAISSILIGIFATTSTSNSPRVQFRIS